MSAAADNMAEKTIVQTLPGSFAPRTLSVYLGRGEKEYDV